MALAGDRGRTNTVTRLTCHDSPKRLVVLRTPPPPSPATDTSPISDKMRNFPQEIVDLVIDVFAESSEKTCGPSTARHPISGYSAVSSQWVRRTQYHHFKLLSFASELDLDKWRAAVDNPDISRASKYVRMLLFFNTHLLEVSVTTCMLLPRSKQEHFTTAPRFRSTFRRWNRWDPA